MRLLIVRHAPAQDRDEFWQRTGQDDSQRPLTAEGKAKMRKAAAGLAALLPKLDVLASSPYRRARETCEILQEHYAGAEVLEHPVLAPGTPPESVAGWLAQQPAKCKNLAIIGHEPELGCLAAWLSSARSESFLHLKKGAACLLQGEPAAGRMTLLWALTPGQLRKIAAARKF
jgi:phosphohistidine phosphatase